MESAVENRWKESGQPTNPDLVNDSHLRTSNQEQETASQLWQIDSQPVARRRFADLILANSFAVSLVLHLIILISLSLISYSLYQGNSLSLELVRSDSDDMTILIESDSETDQDGGDLDAEMEQMLAAANVPASFEVNADPFEFDPSLSFEDSTGSDSQTSKATASLISSNRKVGTGKDVNFFGIQAAGKDFVFIVDSSTSMRGRRWDNALRELRNSLSTLQSNQRFYVIFFDKQTHLMLMGRSKKFSKTMGDKLKLKHATEENLNRFEKWLKRVTMGSDTLPRVSFDYGLSLDPDAIFFLTDGEFNDGTYEYLMSLAAQTATHPSIHTVAFGNRTAGRTLEQIAERFNGQYRFVQ